MSSISASNQPAFDVPRLVSDLMRVERRPIEALNAKITRTQSKISALGTVNNLIATLRSAASAVNTAFARMQTNVSSTALSAAAQGTATPGSYTVQVNQLAQSQSLVAAGQASKSAAIGDGSATTLQFEFGRITGGTLSGGLYSGATFTPVSTAGSLVIDSSNNTLEGIRDAINAANLGVRASLVNDGSGSPWRLALTSIETGESSSLRISASGGDGSLEALLGYDPAGTQNLMQTQAAQNASLTVDGLAITSVSNTLTTAIEGVNLTLRTTTPSPVRLDVTRDTDAASSAVQGFVDAYNALMTQMRPMLAWGSDGKNAGVLAGDGALRAVQDQLRDLLGTPATGGAFSRLLEVGITSRKDGTLAVDSAALSSALGANFGGVRDLFAAPGGFAKRLEVWAGDTLKTGGLLDQRRKSFDGFIRDRNAEIDRLELRMQAIEKKYVQEYTNLNLMLSRMNTTSAFLTQQLAMNQKSDR